MARSKSQNGYPVPPPSTRKFLVPGAKRHFVLVDGWAGFLLVCFATYWHEQVEDIDNGIWDEWGGAPRSVRGSSTTMSNHASFTAIDVNATKYPLGLRRMPTSKKVKLRAHAATYAGCLRLGLDYSNRADEMHVEVNRGQSAVNRMGRLMAKTARGKRVLAANPGFAAKKGLSSRAAPKPAAPAKPVPAPKVRVINEVRHIKPGLKAHFRAMPTALKPVGKVLSTHTRGNFRFDREVTVGSRTWLRLSTNQKKWINKSQTKAGRR